MPGPNNGQPVPPKGYNLEVNPPPGYVLENDFSDVPAFIKQGVDMGKVQQVTKAPVTEQDRNSIAEVDDFDPYKVKVLAPDQYGPPILNHELTHTYQDTRAEGITPAVPVKGFDRKNYDYGGWDGLKEARSQGKTVSDFNYEQQAQMVKDYKIFQDNYLKLASQGKITPAAEKGAYDIRQAYHPFIKQMAEMPGKDMDLKRNSLLELLGLQKPVDINRKPEPPGLPRYDTPGLGVLPADPLMGGKSQPTSKEKQPESIDSVAGRKYRFLRSHNVSVIYKLNSPLPYQSETWASGVKKDRPKEYDLGKDYVEIYKKGVTPDDYAAEVFSHIDTRGKAYAQQLLGSMDKPQLESLKQAAGDYKATLDAGMTEDEALRNASQAALRGFVFNQWPKSAIDELELDTKQKQLLLDARKYALTGK